MEIHRMTGELYHKKVEFAHVEYTVVDGQSGANGQMRIVQHSPWHYHVHIPSNLHLDDLRSLNGLIQEVILDSNATGTNKTGGK